MGFGVTLVISLHRELLEPFCETMREKAWTVPRTRQVKLVFNGFMTGLAIVVKNKT